jgi:hypothetical protein
VRTPTHPMTSSPLSTRIRLYVTLILQALPFLVLLVATVSTFNLNALLVLAPLAVAITGILIELAARSLGRSLTLLGLGLQTLAMIALVVMAIVTTEDFFANLEGDDLLLLVALLLPLYLLVWNFLGGRSRSPKPAAS